MHIFMTRNKVFICCLMAKPCLSCCTYFDWLLLCIFSFGHKRGASNQMDFNIVKFNSLMFSRNNDSLEDEMHLLLLWWFASDTISFKFIYITSVVTTRHIFMAMSILYDKPDRFAIFLVRMCYLCQYSF